MNHPKETAVALPRAERSPRQSRSEALIDAGAAIDRAPPKGDDIAFTHSIFCQVGLPRRQTEGASFKRQFGNAWICVSAGYLDEGQGPVLQPVPYGPAPRHLMAYMNTYAIRHRTREIPIGEDITDLLRLIGQENQGGNRYKTARLHLHALAASRVQLGYRGRTFNDQPIEQFDAWSSDGSTRNRRWPGVLLLSKSYYESLKGAGVPIDRRALRAIGGAALDIDVYTWLAHRLTQIDQPQTISWRALQDQFGDEYKDSSNFRREMNRALKVALAVYPEARQAIEPVRGGLRLRHASPPVPPKRAS